MKTLKFIASLFLILTVGGCTNDNSPAENTYSELYDVELAFNIGIDSGVDTKASDSFETTDCKQSVSDLRIYVFRSTDGKDTPFTLYNVSGKSEEEQLYFKVDAFNGSGSVEEIEEHTYRLPTKLAAGYYRFLAVGRDEDVDTSERKIEWKAGETKWEDALMTNEEDGANVSEIFSGFAAENKTTPRTVKVEGAGGFLIDITLRRAVAGVFLYVENIPCDYSSEFNWTQGSIKKGDKCYVHKLAVVSYGHEKKLNLVSRSRVNDFKGIENSAAFAYYTLTEISYDKDWTSKDGKYYDQKPAQGRFVFPAGLVENPLPTGYFREADDEKKEGCSLALCLFGNKNKPEDGGEVYPLIFKPIKMGNTENVHPDDYAVDATDPGATPRRYSLFANHLYCLGNKDKDTDKPVDLKENLDHPELEIIVVGSWQAIVDIEMK